MKKVIALVLGLTMVLAVGCSNKGNNEAPASAGETKKETAQGITADKIVVGTTGAQQGAYAFIGKPYFDAMNAYFKELNSKGGVGGKQVELKVLEDEFKAEQSIANVQKLINDEKVFAIVGLFGTPGVKASTPMIADAGIPAVYFATGASITTKSGPNFFPVQPNYIYEGKLMSMYARDFFKSKKTAVIYRTDDAGVDGLAGFEAGAKELGTDSSIVAKLPIDVGTTDATAQIAKIKESGADFIVAYALSGELSVILKEVEKAGLNIPILTTYSNVSDAFIASNVKAAPNAIKNLHGLSWVDPTRPAAIEFAGIVKKHYPDAVVNAYSMSGWIAAETFTKGLELAIKDNGGSTDGLSWEAYVKSMETINYTDGILNKIAYPNGERNGATNMCVAKVDGPAWVNVTEFKEFTK
jgi:branched-chain amino acid transport system substrate-binding protein